MTAQTSKTQEDLEEQVSLLSSWLRRHLPEAQIQQLNAELEALGHDPISTGDPVDSATARRRALGDAG